jgi:hypothetical protein
MSVTMIVVCCQVKDLCVGLIARPEEFDQIWCNRV